MWKVALALILLAAAAGTGYYYGSGNVVKEKGETITVIRDRIVTHTVIRNPDGTVTETTKEEEINHSTASVTESTTPKAQSRYRVGANYSLARRSDITDAGIRNMGITGSIRALGPIWLDAEIRPFGPRKEAAVGVSIEF